MTMTVGDMEDSRKPPEIAISHGMSKSACMMAASTAHSPNTGTAPSAIMDQGALFQALAYSI